MTIEIDQPRPRVTDPRRPRPARPARRARPPARRPRVRRRPLPWNVAVDQRPAAVAFPRTAAEVADRRPRRRRRRPPGRAAEHRPQRRPARRPGPRRRRHRPHLRDGPAIADPVRGIVRVEGGAIWEPAVDAAAAHGQAVLHGSSPDVGIAGYSLGGGIGWYARKLGLATNSITAVEIVIADGTLVRADATTNAELFWAVRGGGGNFGVVTALEFKMFDIQTAYAGMLMWDLADDRAGAARVGRLGPDRPGRGHHVVPRDAAAPDARAAAVPARPASSSSIDGAVLGSDERGAELLAGLRALRAGDGHLRPGPGQVAGPAAHGPRGRRPVRLRQRDARRRSPTPRSTRSSPRPARTPRPRC